MNDELKMALLEAMKTEYKWTEDWDADSYEYTFSRRFEEMMRKICRLPEHSFVSVGHFRLRKAVAVLIAALLIMTLAGCAFAVREAIINWNETSNDKQGTLDVHVIAEDPDNTLTDVGFVKPKIPAGYTIKSEEKDSVEYCICYEKGDLLIQYSQMKDAENIGLSIDNDDPEFREIEINKYKGYSKYKDYDGYITWSDGIYLYWIDGNCQMKVLEEMARSVGK